MARLGIKAQIVHGNVCDVEDERLGPLHVTFSVVVLLGEFLHYSRMSWVR